MPVRGRTAGNKGQGSKWISKKTRYRIYARDGWRCVWCGRELRTGTLTIDGCAFPVVADATLDHVIPRSEGGTNQPSNLVTSCMRCNRGRGDGDVWRFAGVIGRITRTVQVDVILRVLKAVCAPLPPAA